MDQKTAEYVINQCACFHFRKASRAVTQLFDRTLAPAGLRSTQLVILVLLQSRKAISLSELSQILGLEQSSMSRIALLLKRNGWVKIQKDKQDQRARTLMLTRVGSRLIDKAAPLWQKAQSLIVKNVGAAEFDELRVRLKGVIKIGQPS